MSERYSNNTPLLIIHARLDKLIIHPIIIAWSFMKLQAAVLQTSLLSLSKGRLSTFSPRPHRSNRTRQTCLMSKRVVIRAPHVYG